LNIGYSGQYSWAKDSSDPRLKDALKQQEGLQSFDAVFPAVIKQIKKFPPPPQYFFLMRSWAELIFCCTMGII